jgi:hypothetical protein
LEEGIGKKMAKRAFRHQSFILSLWLEHEPMQKHSPDWRLSLENPMNSDRWGFKDLTELSDFLEEWMREMSANKSLDYE